MLAVTFGQCKASDHLAQLLTCGDVADADSANCLDVEQRQPLGKKFAVDHPFTKPGDGAKTHTLGKFVKRPANAAHVICLDMLKPVAQHDPVNAGTISKRTGLAHFPDQFGIKARFLDAECFGIDLADQIKVNEAVVDRRHDGIGPGERCARNRIIAAGRIDDDEIGTPANPGNLLIKAGRRKQSKRRMHRRREGDFASSRGALTIVEIARQRLLARVKVNRGNRIAGRRERDCCVNSRCRFAGSALFIGKNNIMRLSIDHKRAQNPLDHFAAARHRAALRHIGARPAVQTIRHIAALRNLVNHLRDCGGSVALVPTMGALHAGHMALVARAKAVADHVMVSIFVNPTQFGPNEDLASYPRQEATDAALLAKAGVAALWLPGVEIMYPDGFATAVSVTGLGDGLCGAARPGHFDGVATVVAKLLLQVKPDTALFGEKDWQQLAIIRRMVSDLDLNVEIIGAPIIRDADGLALSSRNAYLSPGQRIAALALPRTLQTAALELVEGNDVAKVLDRANQALLAAGFSSVDYVALIDGHSLKPLDHLKDNARILGAARMATTRLIDNFAVSPKN